MSIKTTSYQRGNTIRLRCEFKNFEGVLTDPTIVKVVIYNNKYNKLHEQVLDNQNRLEIGIYYYDYTPSEDGVYYYEWYGEIIGNPTLKRSAIKVTFI